MIRGKNVLQAVIELLHINSTEVMEIYGLVKIVNDLLHIVADKSSDAVETRRG